MICSRCRLDESKTVFGTHRSYCRQCYGEWRKEWRKNNKEKVKAQIVRAKKMKPDRFLVADRKSYWKNRLKRIAKSRSWNIRNKAVVAAREASRRAVCKLATPAWANQFFIEEAYDLAIRRTKITGFKWSVDHIVPLKSKLVCGLHTHNNLRVIPSRDNIIKGNRHWPDMPC